MALLLIYALNSNLTLRFFFFLIIRSPIKITINVIGLSMKKKMENSHWWFFIFSSGYAYLKTVVVPMETRYEINA